MKNLFGTSLIVVMIFFSSHADAKFNLIPSKNYRVPPMESSFETFGQSDVGELNPDSINIFIWNLYKGKRDNWKNDYPKLVENADILLLQEVYMNRNMEDVLLDTSFEYNFGVSFLYKYDHNTPTGSAIGSRIQPLDPYFFRSSKKELLIKTPKTITYALYPIKNHSEELLVLNIHGLNFTPDSRLKHQIKETEELIKGHSGPIVFAGDFNTRTRKRLRQTRSFMKKHGFFEVKFPGKQRKAFMGNILDLAFVRGLEVTHEDVFEHIKSSDHKALWLSLKMP